MLFRLLATALHEENQRGAAALAVPPRAQCGAERSRDPGEIPLVPRDLAMPRGGAAAAGPAGVHRGRRRSSTSASCRLIVGQMEVKAALDAAATEVQRDAEASAATTSNRNAARAHVAVHAAQPRGDDRRAGLPVRLGHLLQFPVDTIWAAARRSSSAWPTMSSCWATNASGATCSTPSSSSAPAWRLQLVIGMALALALYAATRGVRLISLLNFLPSIVTPVVAAMFLRWIFIGRWGLLDCHADLVSTSSRRTCWAIPVWASVTVILADTWQFTPFMILVLYAGLNSVRQEPDRGGADRRRRRLDAAALRHPADRSGR